MALVTCQHTGCGYEVLASRAGDHERALLHHSSHMQDVLLGKVTCNRCRSLNGKKYGEHMYKTYAGLVRGGVLKEPYPFDLWPHQRRENAPDSSASVSSGAPTVAAPAPGHTEPEEHEDDAAAPMEDAASAPPPLAALPQTDMSSKPVEGAGGVKRPRDDADDEEEDARPKKHTHRMDEHILHILEDLEHETDRTRFEGMLKSVYHLFQAHGDDHASPKLYARLHETLLTMLKRFPDVKALSFILQKWEDMKFYCYDKSSNAGFLATISAVPVPSKLDNRTRVLKFAMAIAVDTHHHNPDQDKQITEYFVDIAERVLSVVSKENPTLVKSLLAHCIEPDPDDEYCDSHLLCRLCEIMLRAPHVPAAILTDLLPVMKWVADRPMEVRVPAENARHVLELSAAVRKHMTNDTWQTGLEILDITFEMMRNPTGAEEKTDKAEEGEGEGEENEGEAKEEQEAEGEKAEGDKVEGGANLEAGATKTGAHEDVDMIPEKEKVVHA